MNVFKQLPNSVP